MKIDLVLSFILHFSPLYKDTNVHVGKFLVFAMKEACLCVSS